MIKRLCIIILSCVVMGSSVANACQFLLTCSICTETCPAVDSELWIDGLQTVTNVACGDTQEQCVPIDLGFCTVFMFQLYGVDCNGEHDFEQAQLCCAPSM